MSATKPTPDDAARLDDAELATVEETDGYFLLATAAKRYRIPLAELTAAVEHGFLEATKINGRLHTTAVCIQRWQTRPPEPPARNETPRLSGVAALERRVAELEATVNQLVQHLPARPSEPRGETTKKS
jgi:hypothetical protein